MVNVSADESVLGADGKVDPEKLNVILYDGIQMTYRAVGPMAVSYTHLTLPTKVLV